MRINIQLIPKKQFGFTLIELMIVVSIFATLLGISTISLSNLIPHTSFVTSEQSLLSDIKTQQFNAMVGNTGGSGSSSPYGIYLESDQYTLFTGPAYNPNATSNFTIKLPPTLNITNITFSANILVFSQNSGEISGYNPLAASFQLQNTSSGETKTFDFNKLGIIAE